ncbi:MAG: hypothetical protein A3K19_25160 [Lentisphaerae bacterium RIFOXYB12_FULL_65_16]|nr:MAG: hypothetical protein A3K18_00745 [Lentisphaerae bacterium RIFOXYA12_64_32]OGV91035.1 MAG: hypothetical protein A3K19_25160 [Lentisphaerae bacterium RIFOXYB12_FULL_65_16]
MSHAFRLCAAPISRRRFTLIELLVVIAIIAILASLLLPALRTAKDKAKSTECQGSLKQQGAAFYMYATDYEEFIPNPSDGVHLWFQYVAYYAGVGDWGVTVWPTIDQMQRTVFWCPSWKPPTVSYSGYGMNVYIPPMTGWADVYSPTIKPMLRKSLKPDAQILTADSGDWHLATDPTAVTTYGDYKFDRFRHQMGANILFCDSHIAWMSGGQIAGSMSKLFKP